MIREFLDLFKKYIEENDLMLEMRTLSDEEAVFNLSAYEKEMLQFTYYIRFSIHPVFGNIDVIIATNDYIRVPDRDMKDHLLHMINQINLTSRYKLVFVSRMNIEVRYDVLLMSEFSPETVFRQLRMMDSYLSNNRDYILQHLHEARNLLKASESRFLM